jgi:hypothetical protein
MEWCRAVGIDLLTIGRDRGGQTDHDGAEHRQAARHTKESPTRPVLSPMAEGCAL